MNTRSDARILPVAIMTAIEMTILRFSSTQNDRRISTAVVSFPLPTSSSRSTVRPTESLPATFAPASSSVERSFYFLLSEFIFIHHFLEYQFLHQEIKHSLNVECVNELFFATDRFSRFLYKVIVVLTLQNPIIFLFRNSIEHFLI
jgi:hypothetical protein